MIWALTICGLAVALFLVVLVAGLLHLRASARQALGEIQHIELEDIDALVQECIDVFQQKFGVTIDLDNCEDAAAKLDAAFLNHGDLKQAFSRVDFHWYFAKPVGACLGELLRRHARHEWQSRPGNAPSMVIRIQEGNSEVYPFEKVIKTMQFTEPGDLLAYIAFARAIAETGGDVLRLPGEELQER